MEKKTGSLLLGFSYAVEILSSRAPGGKKATAAGENQRP
jgi:hypothetical protein